MSWTYLVVANDFVLMHHDGAMALGLLLRASNILPFPTTGRGAASMVKKDVPPPQQDPQASTESTQALLRELVAHLRQNRTQLREEWARRITRAQLLTAMTEEEIFAEATSVYDNYVEALETGTFEALQAYARNLSERIIPRGVETHEVVGIVLLLRDVLARSLFAKYHEDFNKLNRILDAYEPAANRIANTVAVGFVQERERVIRQQQEAIRELSTPVLQVRERLLILPIIGLIDPQRARQLTEQLLQGIRSNRAKVVVMDITGVPSIDVNVANYLVQTVDASGRVGRFRSLGVVIDVTVLDVIDSFSVRTLRAVVQMLTLRGAETVIVGIQPEVAFAMVQLGVTLEREATALDLEEGLVYLDQKTKVKDRHAQG